MVAFRCLRALAALLVFLGWATLSLRAQQPAPSSGAKAAEIPAKIGLLDTRFRVEANGDLRKEVTTRVHINNEIGVRQFSRLNFDYDREFQQIEITSVRITHASGGTADILPSAISDQPSPAVADAPVLQDVRIKSIRILGLAPGDDLEYRVVTTASGSPLVPNFYISHEFATEGLVLTELFEVDIPSSRFARPWTSTGSQLFETQKTGEGSEARTVYRWKRVEKNSDAHGSKESGKATTARTELDASFVDSDVVLTSFATWAEMARALQGVFGGNAIPTAEIRTKADELTRNAAFPEDKLRALYDFASQKLVTVDLPLGATGFRLRSPGAILASRYATPEEKCSLLYTLARSIGLDATLAGALPSARTERGPAIPSIITNVLVIARGSTKTFWLDPSVEVAPFGMIASTLRGRPALLLSPTPTNDARFFESIPKGLPFPASQRVSVDASLGVDGTLRAKVHYSMRGENELLLRVAFHQAAREKWKDVAQLMSLSDGFRGKILSASASDPSATKLPFTVDYEITQPKFVDWSKQPVRIPAILPLLGLPEPPPQSSDKGAPSSIDLGTPLNVDTRLTLRVPAGVSVLGPTGTSVERDYATFTSHYAAEGSVIFASRQIRFILREVPAARATDYSTFLHAVQTDQAQLFTLERSSVSSTSKPDAEAKTVASEPQTRP
jgi:Domain of Unknown Function with PDB structure (DUF3857)